MFDRLPKIGPQAYARSATVAFVLLVAIIFTGAAVRLTGSGLGCPTWPKCNGSVFTTELDYHGAIEYGNRMITGLVGIAAIAAALLAFRRRPYRKDLARLGLLLPLGVVAQAGLGGLVVLSDLAPGLVIGHFLLSLLILVASFALMWRSRWPDDTPPKPVEPRNTVQATRAVAAVAAWVLLLGTITTGSGPHPGTHGEEIVSRFTFHGGDTLDWMIHWHGRFSTFLGLCSVALFFYLRKQNANASLRKASTALCLLLAAQGIVGFVQYDNELPAGVVWLHVALATCTWITILWAVSAAGKLAQRQQETPAPSRAPA